MDYPVCSFIKICLVKYIIPNCSTNWVIYLFLLKCARQQQGTDWCGYYVCDYLHIMTPCGKTTDEEMRVRPNCWLVYFHNYTNTHDVNPFFLNNRCLKWVMNVTLLIGSTPCASSSPDSFWTRSWILEASSTTTVTSIEDFHRAPEGTSSWTTNMTRTFINIFKRYALMFVNL